MRWRPLVTLARCLGRSALIHLGFELRGLEARGRRMARTLSRQATVSGGSWKVMGVKWRNGGAVMTGKIGVEAGLDGRLFASSRL